MDADVYLSQRLEPQLAWLGKASRANKAAYLRYRLLGIGLGALITILAPYAGDSPRWKGVAVVSLAIQLCGAGVAVCGALLALNQHQENWLRYRSLKEALEREKWLYSTGSGEGYGAPGGFQRFVRTSETLMGEERSIWMQQAREAAPDRPAATAGPDDAVPAPEDPGAGNARPHA